jgi:uncharacterized protein
LSRIVEANMTIDWTHFTPLPAVLGGLLIGCAAAWLLLVDGRVLGSSGLLGGLIPPQAGDWPWRAAALIGLALSPAAARLAFDAASPTIAASAPTLVAGGLLVGLGTRLANGCTTGHGVCGLARLSRRSLVAVVSFMTAGVVTVFFARHVF